MSTTDAQDATTERGTGPDPQPWRTPEDAKGWRVVGVGKRHPRWLEFEIAAIASRYDPLGFGRGPTSQEAYRPAGRAMAAQLRRMDPEATSDEDVQRLVHATFVTCFGAQAASDAAAHGPMAEEILAAWRQHARRAVEAPAGPHGGVCDPPGA